MYSKTVTIICAFIVVLTSEVATARSAKHYDRANHANVARRLVHKSNWMSVGTVSTAAEFLSFPMVNVKSMADSALGDKSTGNIYFLLTDLDFTGKDLQKLNKLTVLFSDEQDMTCTRQNIDAMEPTCARVIIAGHNQIMNNMSAEYNIANAAFTSRHPASINWRRRHTFHLCELIIEKIALLDFYGGAKYITPEEYYTANFDDDNDNNDVAGSYSEVNPSVISPKSN